MKIITAIICVLTLSASIVSANWEIETPQTIRGNQLTVPYNVRMWTPGVLHIRAEPFSTNIYGQGVSSPSVTVSTPTVSLDTGYNTGEVTFTFLRTGKYELTMAAFWDQGGYREWQINPEPIVVEVKSARFTGVTMTLSRVPDTFCFPPNNATFSYGTLQATDNQGGPDGLAFYIAASSSYRPIKAITIEVYYFDRSTGYLVETRVIRPRFPRMEGGYFSEFNFTLVSAYDLLHYRADATVTATDYDGATGFTYNVDIIQE